jgi:raffinose/stachyose/melibiose transport system substrate-binding protein
MATNEKGHAYMVNEAKMIPAFTNVTLYTRCTILCNVANGLLQEKLTLGYKMTCQMDLVWEHIAPLYESFAKGDIDKANIHRSTCSKNRRTEIAYN